MKNENDHIKNLQSKEAVEKMRELVNAADICMFTTRLQELPLNSRPMSTQSVDEEGNIWFISSKESDKNAEIDQDNRVQLFYSNQSKSEYLSVSGTASISIDRTKIDEYWTPVAKAWFPEGKDDPNVTLIKVAPNEAYYWDTKYGKMVSLLKILTGMVTGKVMDGGIEGTLRP